MSAKGAKLARQQEEESKRKELAAEWEEKRQEAEAVANANWEDLDDELRVSSIWYRQHPFEAVIPLKNYIEEGIERWHQKQPIVVTGMYADEEKVSNIYKQKFVAYIRACNSGAFRDLKDLRPIYRPVFGSERFSFEKIFDWHSISKLVEADYSLDTNIWHALSGLLKRVGSEQYRIEVRPNKYQQHDFSHRWGNFRLLLNLAFLKTLDPRDERFGVQLEQTANLIAGTYTLSGLAEGNAEIERALEMLDRLVVEAMIKTESSAIHSARRIVGQVLGDDSEKKVDGFLELLVSLLDWSAKYRLEKDWLLRYACWFLDQGCHEAGFDMFRCEVPILNSRSLYTDKFEFKFEEWFPGDERKEDYEARLVSAFREALEKFFQLHGRWLNLDRSKSDRVKGVTRPIDPDYESVKWLIAWNEGATYDQIAVVFGRLPRSIIKAINGLKDFNLPIRGGRRGRRSGGHLSKQRLAEIKALKI